MKMSASFLLILASLFLKIDYAYAKEPTRQMEEQLKKRILSALEHINQNSLNKSKDIVQEICEDLCPQLQRMRKLKEKIDHLQHYIKNTAFTPPVVSFIIPCYNRAHVLKDVVASIYSQKLSTPFEVIAVDDASTDNSYEVLLAYEKEHNNFFVYRNECNQKAPATRNTAICHARGRYIVNADSDDVFEGDTIESILKDMIEQNYQVAFFQTLKFFNDHSFHVASSSTSHTNEITVESFLSKQFISPCAGNRIFTKDAWLHVGGYLEEPGHDSWSFSFKLFANGYAGYVKQNSSYLHRLWSNKQSMWWDDYHKKVNDISPKRVVRESLELFTKKSRRIVQRERVQDGKFLQLLQNTVQKGTLKFIPRKQLTPLLKAYASENTDAQLSLVNFLEAINSGLHELTVYLRAAHVALQVSDKKMSFWLLNQALDLLRKE